MSEGLLHTKLQIPQERPSLVLRPRLFEKLNAGLAGSVTLVAAPAGFGKSTLVTAWVRHEACYTGKSTTPPVAWLSLDEQDNDLARFLAYLVAALETVLPDAGDISLAILRGPQAPPVEAFITPLINDINRASEPFLLVLDDYHVIKEQKIHDVMAFLLGHLPPSLHLVLVSRADPPLPLARLRGQGALHEVRQSDLCFTVEEASEFLNEVLGLELAIADVQRLTRRAEGWPAGLQMAAVSLRQQTDPVAFIQAFTGSNRYILDYLMAEVLSQQPADIQQFLLLTSVLDRFTASLCTYLLAATPGTDGVTQNGEVDTTVLDYLDAANLFVVPLDDQRNWYRYHRLFADLLRQRLYQTAAPLVPALHARARDWFWQEGWLAEAVDHALQAGDDAEAARLVEEAAEMALQRSQTQTILRWVEALPDKQVRQRPRLALYYAWALFLSGAPIETIEAYLPQLSGDERQLPPGAALMYAFLATFRGQMRQARALARQALDAFEPDDRFWRSMAIWVLSISYHDPTAASPAEGHTWEDAARVAEESGNLLVMVSALSEQGHMYKRHGRLHDAHATFEQALALATPSGEQPLPIAGEALMGMAEIELEWNHLDRAETLLVEGLNCTRQWREIAALPGYFQLARLRQAQDDVAGAEAALREAARLATLFDATELDDAVVVVYQLRQWIMQGKLGSAQAWVKEHDLPGTRTEYESLRPFEDLTLSRLLLAQGEIDAALDLQDRLLPVFVDWQHARLTIETLLLRAQSYAGRGEIDAALADLREALKLGEAGAFIRIFVDEGEPVLRLLGSLRAQTRSSLPYVGTLLTAFGTAQEGQVALPSQALVEPLSERELEILQLIAEGLSNREIGQRLFLSLPTVKWHSSNIYGKLGVKNRTTAVAKARELDILPSQ